MRVHDVGALQRLCAYVCIESDTVISNVVCVSIPPV